MGDEKTSWLFDKGNGNSDEDMEVGGEFTETVRSADQGTATDGFSEAKTSFMTEGSKTEIYHGGMAENFKAPASFEEMRDPIVGWLVVVKGPGLGQSVSLGSGMNSIGRDEGERVSLNFGDTLISGTDHLRIIYDDDARSFLLAPGSGKNVSKVNRQIVAVPIQLENYMLIELSKQTHVRFVAFCNEEFDWSDLASPEST